MKTINHKISRDASRIDAAAQRTGYHVENHRAGTGTFYLTLTAEDGEVVTVRVADHGECYLPDRPERRIDVSPAGVSLATAIAMLSEPQSIPLVQARELTEDEREYLREQRAYAAEGKRRWQALRAELVESGVLEQWLAEPRQDRPTARRYAERLGLKPAVVWSALTNGRRWERRRR